MNDASARQKDRWLERKFSGIIRIQRALFQYRNALRPERLTQSLAIFISKLHVHTRSPRRQELPSQMRHLRRSWSRAPRTSQPLCALRRSEPKSRSRIAGQSNEKVKAIESQPVHRLGHTSHALPLCPCGHGSPIRVSNASAGMDCPHSGHFQASSPDRKQCLGICDADRSRSRVHSCYP